MTATEIATIIVSISVVLLPAISLLIVTVIGKLREKVVAIEAHVNGEKTAAQGRENALILENKLLRERVEDLKNTASLLAQQVAQSTPSVTVPEPPPRPAP